MLRLLSAAAAAPKDAYSSKRSEDAYFIDTDWIGVADGVGSWAQERIDAGEFARGLMANCRSILARKPGVKDEAWGLLKVMAEATQQTQPLGSSTVVLAGGLADGKNVLHIANMGDSGCLVIRNSKLLVKTRCQTAWANFSYQVCNSKNPKDWKCTMDPVTLGQVLKVPVQLGDIVLCATDGLLDSVTAEQLVMVSSGIIRDGASPQTLANILLLLGRARQWKEDDITVVVSLVVDESTVAISDTNLWARKVLDFAPGVARSLGYGRGWAVYVAKVLLALQGMGEERYFSGLDDNAIRSKLEELSASNVYEKQKRVEEPDLELPSDVKQVLDDYASGKLRLAKYRDTELVSCDNKPNLLLSHLHAGSEALTALDEVQKEKLLGSYAVMLVGGLGSGKTRLLYTYLRSLKGAGLYFTARNSEEHWASADFEYLVNEVLASELRRSRPHCRQSRHSCNRDCEIDLDFTVGWHMRLLLAARMKIYKYCKEKNMSDTQWLLLQAACRALVYSDDGKPVGMAGDVFRTFLARVCKLEESSQNKLINAETLGQRSQFACVIDDVERCRMALHGCFTDRDDEEGLGFASQLWLFVKRLHHLGLTRYATFVFSGAAANPGLLKRQGEDGILLPEVFSKGCWQDAEEVIRYSEEVLLPRKMSDEEANFLRTDVFQRFKGRFTPFVLMLEVMLSRGFNLQDAAGYIERGYTTEEGVPEVTTSLCKSIASSSRHCQALVGWAFFEQSVFGGGPTVLKHEKFNRAHDCELVNELLELGLARLAPSDASGECLVICDEYLVRKAYQNMHGVTPVGWMQPVLPRCILKFFGLRITPGIESVVKYDLVPFYFLRMWREYKGVLEDMPVFKELLKAEDCPVQLKSLSKSRSAFVEKEPVVLPMGEELKLGDFFADLESRGTFLQWSSKDSSSASGAGRTMFDDGTRVGYFHHIHYPDHFISEFGKPEVVKDGGQLMDMEPGVDWQQQVVPDIYLCFVLVHPSQSIEGLPQWSFKEVAHGKLKITLLLGKENMELAFNEWEIDILKQSCKERES